MILSDKDIREAIEQGRIGIEPFDSADVQPSSVDLHVDRLFRTFHNHRYAHIDVKQPMDELTEMVEVPEGEAFILHPGEFVLGSTSEYVKLPDDLVARLEGKSSLGRLGLLIHSSLPGDEEILFQQSGRLESLPIKRIVEERLEGSVIAFDPQTLEVGIHEVTGWFKGAPDRIFEASTASGNSVRLTGGHDLFTVAGDGRITKVPIHMASRGLRVAGSYESDPLRKGIEWKELVDIRDTGNIVEVYDLEVRPGGRKIENFLTSRGIFVSNTAGYVDPGFEGHLTLELSNVANLPITIYPGMKIGQISFFKLTSPADNPYGSGKIGSKYQGQRGPTASRYFENFKE